MTTTLDAAALDDTRRRLDRLRGLGSPGATAAVATPPPAAGRRPWAWLAAGLAAATAGALLWPGLAARAPAATAAPPVPTTPVAANPAPGPAAPAAPVAGTVLEASGFVIAERQATVSSSITGRVARLHVSEGSRVRRGDLIAELDPGIAAAQMAHAQAGVLAAQRGVEVTRQRLEAARRAAARDEDLARQGFISAASLDRSSSEVQALQAQLDAGISQVAVAREQLRIQTEQMDSVRVRAPFDGVVTGLAAHEGEIVSPISGGGGFTRTGICTLLDESSLAGEVDVNERYLARLRVGQRVTVSLPAYPALAFEGRVADLPSAIDRNTAAARVRIRFEQPPAELRAGLRADFAFKAD